MAYSAGGITGRVGPEMARDQFGWTDRALFHTIWLCRIVLLQLVVMEETRSAEEKRGTMMSTVPAITRAAVPIAVAGAYSLVHNSL